MIPGTIAFGHNANIPNGNEHIPEGSKVHQLNKSAEEYIDNCRLQHAL